MPGKLAQLLTDARIDGWLDWITEPDGQVHPNNERALLEGYTFNPEPAQRLQDFCVAFLTLPFEIGERITDYELESIHRRFPGWDPDALVNGKRQVRKPFAMMRWWHRRVMGQLYGWYHPDGYRRYRKAFITTAKKSGKTSTVAALPLAELLLEQVPEKEVYVVASSEDQANILFRKVDQTLNRAPRLAKILKSRPSTQTVVYPANGSIFKTLPAVPGVVEGIQPNLLIMDELHAWRGRELYNALIYGDIRRVNSLRIVITTAGNDINSVAFEEYEAAKELLDPNNDRYEPDTFSFVAEAGRDPITQKDVPWEWDSEESIIQGNPTLLENPAPLAKLRQELETAKNSPAKKRGWIRYICNRYIAEIDDTWIQLEDWDKCGTDSMPDHHGDATWCGFDLARVEDLVALAMAWWAPELDDTVDLRCKFWMPEEGIKDKADRWRLPQLYQWVEDGWIDTTPGNAIETNFLRKAISGVVLDESGNSQKKRDTNAIAELHDIQELAFDRNMAANLVIQQLGDYDGLPVVEHAQSFPAMSVPAKELQRRIINGKIRHDRNPVLRWMFSHCVCPSDANDNIKPDKRKSRHKIDGVVASVMAVGRCTLSQPPEKSVYKRRGILVI